MYRIHTSTTLGLSTAPVVSMDPSSTPSTVGAFQNITRVISMNIPTCTAEQGDIYQSEQFYT